MNTIDNLKSELMSPSKLNSFIKKEFGYEDLLYGNEVLPMVNPLHMNHAYNKTLSAYPTWVPFNANSRLFDLNSLEEPNRLKPHNAFVDETEHFEELIQVKVEGRNNPAEQEVLRTDQTPHTATSLSDIHPNLSYIPYFLGSGPPSSVNFVQPTINCNIVLPPAVNSTFQPNMPHQFQDQTHKIEHTESSYGKIKRARTEFSPSHLNRLEEEFSKSHYSKGTARDELAEKLKVTPRAVTIWFQNRRAKMRAART